MDIQSVPKVGISSVVHSKHIDSDNIDVVDNDIALFDTESVISLYNGPTKLEVLTVGLCLEGTGTFKISLRELQYSSPVSSLFYCQKKLFNNKTESKRHRQHDCRMKINPGSITQPTHPE
jgi:hypothetical protein